MRGSLRSVNVRRAVECDGCAGTGRRGQRVCPACEGEGRVSKSETYQVKVPAGVREGQRLRVAGRGEAGAHGGEGGRFVPARASGEASRTLKWKTTI